MVPTVDNVMNLSGKRDPELAETWLAAASFVIDARLARAGLGAATLDRIKEHFAAHLIEVGAGRQVTSESMPDWSRTYATNALNTLTGTRNGQIAALLDTSGALTEASRPRPQFAVL